MTKLQILIPQYNEDENTIKPLLDSIAIQQGINLKDDIEVFIGNDGSDTKLSVDFLKKYPYRIQYHFFEHGGLAATRYKLQQLANAEYIMFCDADDQFISTIALRIIMNEFKTECDAIICDFMEEHNKECIYIPHHDDAIFVHGKIYRLAFLKENKIEWNPTLREHQDSAFNIVARTLAKKTRICTMPLYMWCDNPNSISRKEPQDVHRVKTWCAMLDSYNSIVNDFKVRGIGQRAIYYAKWALYATYWEMAHEIWHKEGYNDEKIATYKKVIEFYNTHELAIKNCTDKQAQEIEGRTKELALKRGPLVDMPPFDEWLAAILNIFK